MAVSLAYELDELRKDVQQYKPGSEVNHPDDVTFPEHLHIGLFGMIGCGKSSLINSLKFAAAGDLKKKKWLQVAPPLKAGGHNLYRKAVHISSGIYVVDNRGIDKPSTDNALREIAAQLDGKRGYATVVEWQENKREEEEFAANAISGDIEYAIGCVVLVFSAGHDIQFSTSGLKKVVDLVHKHQGRYPMAVITNVDRNERSQVEQLRTVLEINGVSDIFEVANITQKKEKLEETYQHSLLSLLGRCMVDGDESYIFKHHQETERIREKRAQQEQKMRMEEERKAKQHEDKGDWKGGLGALSAGAAAGALIGAYGGPVSAALGAAAGGIISGVGYLFGKEKKQFDSQPLDDLQSSDHSSTKAGENEDDANRESVSSIRETYQKPRSEDPRRTKALIDESGGELHIPSYGFTLSFPPGALEEGSSEEITLDVLTDIPANIQLQDDEIIVSHGFQCYPSGLEFRKPVTLRIPHCAEFDDADKVETALYLWDSLEKESPVRYPHTAIDCMVSETHFTLSLQHFSGGLLSILRNFVTGKLMSCMTYLPKTMPSTKEPVLEVRFVNKPRGMAWSDAHGYNPLDQNTNSKSAMDRDREVFIKRRNLKVSCQMANHQPESKNVENWYFMHKTNHTVDFILDFHDCQTYDCNITLTLAQGSREEQIIFPTRFEGPSQSQLSLVSPTSSSTPRTDANVNEVLEKEISDLADDLGNDIKLRRLAFELGFSYDEWGLYTSSNMRNDGRVCCEGTFFMLRDWKKNTSTDSQRAKLVEALKQTGFAELAEKYSGNLPTTPSSE